MILIVSGIFRDLMPLQFEKAELSMVVTLIGIFNSVNPEQPVKHPDGIDFIVSGIFNVPVSPLQ